MNNKLKPALLGGLIVGILSALPFISTCCCIWAIGGGLVAGMLYIKGAPTQVLPGDGAIVGALSGIVGAVIYLLLGLPIAFLRGTADVEAQLAHSGVHLPFTGTVLLLVGGLVSAVALVVLATGGGLLSVPIFEKRKAGAPPAPPTNMGGGPGSYAA